MESEFNTATPGQLLDMQQSSENTKSEENILSKDFYLGAWLVKPQLNQLHHRQSDLTRHLEPRLAKLLCYLAAHESQVIDRETLVSVLWPRVIVNENSLTRAVSELRKQLNTKDRRLMYIETIPKRGYRLSTPVELVAANSEPASEIHAAENSSPARFEHTQFLPLYAQAKQSAVAALCLSLVLGAWLQFNGSTVETLATNQWTDELVINDRQGFTDEVMLSSSLAAELEVESISKPVLSQDQDQFAYFQYDHTGSTLFLGQVGGEYEPVPVFNSVDILYNLAWSPVGNALLFASKPPLTTALFDKNLDAVSALYSFDLESFRLSKLVEKSPFEQSEIEASELSLT